jgi:uncharacterized protein (TIGR03437 family)
MKMASIDSVALAAILICGWVAPARAAGPTTTPASLSFAYQVNSTTLPAAGKITVSLPSGSASSTVMSVAVSPVESWLAVTPDSGYSPLALTVTVNPTGLAPGSYMGSVTISTTPPSTPAVVPVVLSVSNPPSTLLVTSPSSNYATGSSGPSVSFTYTTGSGATFPVSAELDVASSGDIIPFNVTAALASAKSSSSTATWIKVNQANQLPNTQTSGVALSGSYVPITVTLDLTSLASLDPGSYGGSITIAANSAVNGSITVSINLVISAGQPSLDTIYPGSVVAGPSVNPVITIYGDNFFSTSVVTLQQGTNPAITLSSTLLSRKVLQATINSALLTLPGIWTLSVTNPAPPNNPSQGPVSTLFTVISATQPAILSVVNAASYLATAVQSGTNPDPVSPGATSVSPRQIISIFGQNLGPATVTSATPVGSPLTYPTTVAGINVTFEVNGNLLAAPILMVSSNQINAIVPVGVAAIIGTGNPSALIVVQNNGTLTAPFSVTVVAENPGVFTFGGLGQGQAAILNYDSTTGGYSINSAKAAAARGSTILIYATGMGDLSLNPDGTSVGDGAVASSALTVADQTARVDIAGQPAVVSYAGACPGAVAGLVQINAIVPPTVATGSSVSITVSIGSAAAARRSQSGVTLVVK